MDRKLVAEDLLDLETPKDLHLSKAGTQVVYSLASGTKKLDKEFVSSLWVADVGVRHSARQITSGSFNDRSPKWSPDGGHLVAFISDRAKAGESSAIYLISMKGGEAFPITKADNKKPIVSFEWSPNGRYIAFTSADEKSKEREARDKDKDDAKVYGKMWEYCRLRYIHVATKEVSNLFDDAFHVDQFTWGLASKELVFTTQRTPDMNSPYDGIEFRKVSLGSKASTMLAKFPGPVFALLDAESLYFIASTTPNSTCSSNMVYKLITSPHVAERIVEFAFGVENCAMDVRASGRCVTFHVQQGLSDELYRFDDLSSPAMASVVSIHNEPYELSTWDVVELDSADGKESSKDKTVLCFGKSEGDAPTEIFSKVNNKVVQLSNHGSNIADLHLMEVTPIHCNAKDGTKIDAVLYTPSKSKKKNLAAVVLIHGGPYSRSSTSFDSSPFHWAPWLVSSGYAVLCPNYRGSSGYGEKFASASRAGMGTKDYDDVISLLKEAISLDYIDGERVGIGGWSQGGFLSYLAVTRPDFMFKAAVCGAGISDWDTMSFASDAPVFEAELVGGAPWTLGPSSLVGRHASAVWHMKDVKTPILILHGEEDQRGDIPAQHSLEI